MVKISVRDLVSGADTVDEGRIIRGDIGLRA